MKRYIWRLVTALLVSSSCFLGTVLWYRSGTTEVRRHDVQAIAKLNKTTNEVQRKPRQRVIWEGVGKNDELYAGEAVRTAPNADAQLYFLKSGALVHLDPDSLVVLEQTDKGLALDFLQGDLFVQGGSDSLTLKSGTSEIKLKSADMSLSKDQNGSVSLEVHRGEAELNQGSKKTELNKEKSAELSPQGESIVKDRIEVLHPAAGETLLLNLSKSEKTTLGWKPLASGYHVTVEVGTKRNAMVQLAALSELGEVGHLALTAKPGRWFLRLTATSLNPNQPPLASSVIPFVIDTKSPPLLIEPRPNAAVLGTDRASGATFRWANRNHFSSQVIEIATDANFQHIVSHENFTVGSTTSYRSSLSDGAYFWRVTGFMEQEPLVSLTGKFTIVSKFEIKPPQLISPAENQRLAFLSVQKSGINFKWRDVPSVEAFRVNVERLQDAKWTSIKEQEIDAQSVTIADLQPGSYRWSVTNLDPAGGEGKPSSYFAFQVQELQRIEWIEGRSGNDFVYQTPNPTLTAQWKALPETPASYRYKVASEAADLDGVSWTSTKQTQVQTSVPGEGSFNVLVEALDNHDQVVGQSSIQSFHVKSPPLLPAPQWTADAPPVFKSDNKGNLSLAWDQVEGAERYQMILEGSDGQVVQQQEVSRNLASLSHLKPGNYQVHLKSVDHLKRSSLDGSKRQIEVPTPVEIRAPKIKTVNVK